MTQGSTPAVCERAGHRERYYRVSSTRRCEKTLHPRQGSTDGTDRDAGPPGWDPDGFSRDGSRVHLADGAPSHDHACRRRSRTWQNQRSEARCSRSHSAHLGRMCRCSRSKLQLTLLRRVPCFWSFRTPCPTSQALAGAPCPANSGGAEKELSGCGLVNVLATVMSGLVR